MAWLDSILLSDILDASQNILDQGALTIAVAIKVKEPPPAAYVPKNPFQIRFKISFSMKNLLTYALKLVRWNLTKTIQGEQGQ